MTRSDKSTGAGVEKGEVGGGFWAAARRGSGDPAEAVWEIAGIFSTGALIAFLRASGTVVEAV